MKHDRPHITYAGGGQWKCSGGGLIGFGMRPTNALWSWLIKADIQVMVTGKPLPKNHPH